MHTGTGNYQNKMDARHLITSSRFLLHVIETEVIAGRATDATVDALQKVENLLKEIIDTTMP